MRVIHRANTCFSVFSDNYHILFDPWLNGPAVAQGWTQFPPATKKIEDIPKPDLVYISHIHSDHCESTTLDGIDGGLKFVSAAVCKISFIEISGSAEQLL